MNIIKYLNSISIFFIFYLLFFLNVGQAQIDQNSINQINFSTMSGNFSHTILNTSSKDSIFGKFYFFNKGKVFFDIKFPLNQIMIIEKNSTIIYYPDSKRAFSLTSKNNVILPLISGLLSAIQEDYGLTLLGFEIYNQKIENDSIITFWTIPEVSDEIGSFKLIHFEEKLYSIIYESPKLKNKTKTFFKNYIILDNIRFPTLIESEITSLQEKSYEKVFLSNLTINNNIPEEILNFKIPENIYVEEKEW